MLLFLLTGCSNGRQAESQPITQASKIENLSTQIQTNPESVELLLERGNLLRDAGDFEPALEDFTKVLKVEPGNQEAIFGQDYCFRNLGEYENSIDVLSELVGADPKNVKALRNRAIALRYSKKYPEAIADCEKAISIDPEYAPAYYSRAFIAADLGLHREAIKHVSRAIENDPSEADYFDFRARSHCNLEQYEQALEDIDQALKLAPSHIHALRRKADIFGGTSNEKAILAYQELLEFHPDSRQDVLSLARCYEAKKDFDLVAKVVSPTVEKTPNDFEARSLRANAYVFAERWPEAYEDQFFLSKEYEIGTGETLSQCNRTREPL